MFTTSPAASSPSTADSNFERNEPYIRPGDAGVVHCDKPPIWAADHPRRHRDNAVTLRDFTLEGLEQAINQVLAMDPRASAKLGALHGKVICVALAGTGLRLYFVPGADGHLQLLGSIEGEPDCMLTGSPIDLARASDREQSAGQLFGGHVRIEGDNATAQHFSEALSELDIDWEEQLSHVTGDIPAHEIGRTIRALLRETKRLNDSASENLSEYLTEELRVLPHRYEVEDFLVDVDQLRDDTERLATRIALLEQAESEGDSKA